MRAHVEKLYILSWNQSTEPIQTPAENPGKAGDPSDIAPEIKDDPAGVQTKK